MIRNKIVLVPFPFDDLTASKVRPAVCLTDSIEPYEHVVLAFITSNIPPKLSSTDLVFDSADAHFPTTGLKVSSTLRLHRLMTVSRKLIKRQLGELPADKIDDAKAKLSLLFDISQI